MAFRFAYYAKGKKDTARHLDARNKTTIRPRKLTGYPLSWRHDSPSPGACAEHRDHRDAPPAQTV